MPCPVSVGCSLMRIASRKVSTTYFANTHMSSVWNSGTGCAITGLDARRRRPKPSRTAELPTEDVDAQGSVLHYGSVFPGITVSVEG